MDTSGVENEPMVDYHEADSIKAGKWLTEKGFELATITGNAEDFELRDAHGIAVLKPLDPQLSLENKRPIARFLQQRLRRPRRPWVGTLWFDNTPRSADTNNWVFEVLGRENVEALTPVAEEMSSTFGVRISMVLHREEADRERFLSDAPY